MAAWSSSCGRSRRRRSTTRAISASSTPWSATAISATRSRAASRSCSRTGTRFDRSRRRRGPQEDGASCSSNGSAERPVRSGARRSCAPRRRPATRPSSTAADVIAMLRAAIEGIKQRGEARSRRQDAARRARARGRRTRGGAGPTEAGAGHASAALQRGAEVAEHRAPRRPSGSLRHAGPAVLHRGAQPGRSTPGPLAVGV